MRNRCPLWICAVSIVAWACARPSQAPAPPPPVAPPLAPPASSSSSAPPRVGADCAKEGALVCSDSTNVFYCRASEWKLVPCRGPGGCTAGEPAKCDDNQGAEGEACIGDFDNFTCTIDHRAELVCVHGQWSVESTCKGPDACAIAGTTVRCDDDFADIGDPCKADNTDANYACSIDRNTRIRCDAGTNRFVADAECLGPRACNVARSVVYCDETVAKEGGVCHKPGKTSCTADRQTLLACDDGRHWAKKDSCAKGCTADVVPAKCK